MPSFHLIKENFKKVAFLVAIFLVCGAIMTFAEYMRTPSVPQGSGDIVANPESQIPEILSQVNFYEELPEIERFNGVRYVDSSGVLGTSGVGGAGLNGCQPAGSPQACESDTIPFQPVCSVGEISVGLNDGNELFNDGRSVTVQKNSTLEIMMISSPQGLLAGIEDMSDNTFAIKAGAEPRFRASSDLIPPIIASQSLAPGSEELEYVLDTIPNEVYPQSKPFSINAGFAGSQGQLYSATVYDELDSQLPREVQPSDSNPGTTNERARVLQNLNAPPTRLMQARDYAQAECLELENVRMMENQGVFETCYRRREPFSFVASAVVNAQQWVQCLTNQELCEEMEIVGLLIDSIYGANNQCNEGYCSDQAFDLAVAGGLSPIDYADYAEPGYESSQQPVLSGVYVYTPCEVRVDYGRPYRIPCLWDMSPYYNLYLSERQMRYPEDEEMLTWDEYWDGVIEAAEARGQACGF